MEMVMEYQISFKSENFEEEFCGLDLGGYTFIINNMEIPFDFDAFGYNIENRDGKAYVNYESGIGMAFNNYELDECFDDEYKLLGLTKKDITAKFLSSASEISEFYIGHEYRNNVNKKLENLKIEYIQFQDCETKEVFKVSEDVINDFNKKLSEMIEVA